MKFNSLKTLAAATISAMVFIGANAIAGHAQTSKNGNSIVGTWQTAVTPRNCATGLPLAPPFAGILTFNQGGTMTGTSTAVTSTYGIWSTEPGQREYSFTTISQRFTPTGMLLGTRKIIQDVSVDGDSFTSNGVFVDADTSGTTVATGCSTSTGERLVQ